MNRNILIWIFFKGTIYFFVCKLYYAQNILVLDHYTKLSFAQCSLDGFLVTTEGPCFYDLEVTAKFYQVLFFILTKNFFLMFSFNLFYQKF